MVFSSIFFIFGFLPIFMLLYYLVPRKLQNPVLIIGSLFFYAWGEPVYVVLMLFSAVFNYFMGLDLEASGFDQKARKRSLIFAVIINLFILCFFKYNKELPLPIGISFYTFKNLSYIFDVYMGKIQAQKNIVKTTDKEKEFFGKRIVNFLKKCYNRCKNFITKIRKITNKMEMIGDLLEDEDIIDAVKRIKRYGVNGVKLLLPQKLNAKIIFGFEDPYYTGKVLGWTAALIPIYGDHINITPDFEKRILKGELKIKGRIRRYKILHLLWKVYKDKDELIKQKDRAIRMIGGS